MSVLTVDQVFTSDGTTKKYNVPVSTNYMFYAVGEFDGACAVLECSPDNGLTWLTVAKLSAGGRTIHYLVTGEKVRLLVHSSGLGTAVTCGIRQ